MELDRYSNNIFDRGASSLKEGAWIAISGILIESWVPGSSWRVFLLRLFGAKIGLGVVVKPRVRIKFPWRLNVGNHTWIGEGVWIDNLGQIDIGCNACISQGAFLCTGSHDWSSNGFDLVVKPIRVMDKTWIGAFVKLGPGSVVEEGAVIQMGSTAVGIISYGTIYGDGSAMPIKPRYKK